MWQKEMLIYSVEELAEYLCSYKANVSLVGAGGKTTLMYELAQRCSKRGKKVLISTTTHIWKPEEQYAQNLSEVSELWKKGTYAVIGRQEKATKKLVFPESVFFREMERLADIVLIEADGSKGMPCKVPASHEPVILSECNLVVGVMGMSCIGKRVEESCFRFEQEGDWLGVTSDTIMDAELAAKILSSPKGTRKNAEAKDYLVVLNQCDDAQMKKNAQIIRKKLNYQGIPVAFYTKKE